MTISLLGLNKADVLAALFNAAMIRDLKKQSTRIKAMGREEASELLKKSSFIDVIDGRSLKIVLSGNVLDPSYYDSLNGDGLARKVIDGLRNWK